MNYADITVNDRNRVKRFLQRRRLDDAVRRAKPFLRPGARVIDLGGGDGNLLLRVLTVSPDAEVTCYEPVPSMREQAEAALAPYSSARVVGSIEPGDTYDIAFCCEVFEHLPEKQTHELLESMYGVLRPGGIAVVGVPNELYLMALLKGAFRMVRRSGAVDARPRSILRATAGRPDPERWERDFDGFAYIFEHLGFDHRKLHAALQEHFSVESVSASPFAVMPLFFGSEIYFVCRR